MIIGNCGSGKSTLSTKLGKKLKIEVTHLDKIYWKPNWVKPDKKEWESLQRKLVQKKSWIIDGNYKSSMDIRLTAADTVIFLDFPKLLCFYRVIKRRIIYRNGPRPEMPSYLKEQISFQFIKWILSYPRQSIVIKLDKVRSEKQIIILRTPREVENFVNQLS